MGFAFGDGSHAFATICNYAGSNVTHGRLGFGALESGHGFASLLLGYPNMAETPEGLPPMQPRH